MSRESDTKNARIFDRRLIERNIRKGLTTRKDVEKWLKGLPDVAAKAEPREERTPPPR